MIYEAPQIAIEPILNEVVAGSGGAIYLPDDDFPQE